MIRDVFTHTPEKNAAGIYGVRFYIRGKPWIVDIDDSLVFDLAKVNSAAYASEGLPAGLAFARPKDATSDLWGAVLEKAWGKVKGDMYLAG